MNLHDPQRPKILHKPAFISGFHVIPRIQLWPKENGLVEVSLLLPLQNYPFTAKYYTLEVYPEQIPTLVREFYSSPEDFILVHFDLSAEKFSRGLPVRSHVEISGPTVKDLDVSKLLASED